MSEKPTSNRPSQVTVGGWATVAASTMLVFSIFDAMGKLRSVEMREQLTKALTTGSGKDLGLSVEQATEAIRWVLLVGGGAAAAAAILGFFVLQRNHGARIGLTVVLLPIIVSAPFAGGFLAAIVGASTAMLWTRPARDWFAGRPVTQPAPRAMMRNQERDQERNQPPPPVLVPPRDEAAGDDGDSPAPTQGFGAAPTQVAAPPSYPYGDQEPPPVWPQAGRPDVTAMPRAVRVACLLTFVFAGLTALGCLLTMAYLAANADELVERMTDTEQWRQAELDASLIEPALWMGMLMILGWCVAALILGVFTWRRQNWARYLLAASAVMAALFSLLGFPWSLLHLVATGGVVGLLFSQPAKQWFASGSRPPAPPSSPGSGPTHQPPAHQPPAQQPPRPGQDQRPDVW